MSVPVPGFLIRFVYPVLISIVPFHSALALDLDVRSNRSSALDFSVLIERETTDLTAGDLVNELDLVRLGIISLEVPRTGPQLGLLLGYAYADFSGNDPEQAIDMDGYYLGFTVRAYLARFRKFSWQLLGHYIYQSIDGKNDQETASLSWDEFLLALRMQYRLEGLGILYIGAKGGSVDGRYRYRGTTSSRIDLENDNNQGFEVGFDYQINRFESVGINYQQGVMDGFALQFRKLF